MTKRERLIYLAGLFDGEGCVQFHLKKGTDHGGLQISVTNTDLDLLEQFVREFGGSVGPERAARLNWRSSFTWRQYGQNAVAVLLDLSPFLVGKKSQAKLGLKISATPVGRRARLASQLKALKRIDHGNRFAIENGSTR